MENSPPLCSWLACPWEHSLKPKARQHILKQEVEIAVKIHANPRGPVQVGNGREEFLPGEFNEQASPETGLLLYGKACKIVGFVPWLRGCPLCCTVAFSLFRAVGRRNICIFLSVFNSYG